MTMEVCSFLNGDYEILKVHLHPFPHRNKGSHRCATGIHIRLGTSCPHLRMDRRIDVRQISTSATGTGTDCVAAKDSAAILGLGPLQMLKRRQQLLSSEALLEGSSRFMQFPLDSSRFTFPFYLIPFCPFKNSWTS